MQNLNFIIYNRALVNENKWRASRYGIDGSLIDFGKEEEVNARLLISELLDFVDDVVDDLGSRHYIEHTRHILENGTGADQQLKVYAETRDLKSVTDFIINQFLKDC
jgi:carboxylate-amine ligase